MDTETIIKELEDFEGDVFFVSLLNEYVWNVSKKQVVGYNSKSDYNNELMVKKTLPIDIKTTLLDHLKENEITEEDVLVFCINKDFYPKKPGNWVLMDVIKKVNKKIQNLKIKKNEPTKQ